MRRRLITIHFRLILNASHHLVACLVSFSADTHKRQIKLTLYNANTIIKKS